MFDLWRVIQLETVDILILDADELVTLKGPNRPRTKGEMDEISIIKKGCVAIKDGVIVEVGRDLRYDAERTFDARGKTVMPGFVDPHTHLVFAGSREFELDMKLRGLSYMDIMKKGGGIFYTVEETRKASDERLFQQSKDRLDAMLSYGTTTCEAKSGYGLNTEMEVKILRIQKRLNEEHLVDVVSTFLGAHAVPRDMNSERYVDVVVEEMLPRVKGLAGFCDVFCEKDVFSIEQSKRILEAGKTFGLTPKIHADEIVDTNGASLAAEVDAVSADHLLMSHDNGLRRMAERNVIGVLLPGTSFSLMQGRYADARRIIELGVPVALATDLNPNCWSENMQFMVQLACYCMKMTPAESITAATFNAACALGLNNSIGSIEKGKQADVLILNCPNHLFLPYHFGVNLVDVVIKKGCVAIDRCV
jgi:imidazolonepropionase